MIIINRKTALTTLIMLINFIIPAHAQEQQARPQTLITNVNIFDGKADELIMGQDVLVEKNLIKEIGKNLKANNAATVIDAKGKTLMPGIIEGHGHIGLPPVAVTDLPANADWQYIGVGAAVNAKIYLDSGWTTVRDAGGPSFGIKKAIDEGWVPGPRVYPAGRLISQTSGHADIRPGYAAPHPNDLTELPWANREFFAIADGVPEVLRSVREELRKGAVHIKLMAGGGISSQYDPIHTTQSTPAEMKAAVDAAADWGTYVMVHAYTDASVRRAIEAGVKVIEHGQLMTDETAKLVAKKGVWFSTQIAFLGEKPTPEQIKIFGEVTAAKFISVQKGLETSLKFAKKYDLKVAFGTDLWGPRIYEITKEFTYRKKYFSNIEILKQATSLNGELLRLTGKLNPYPQGPIGVIEKGAYADLLVVDGNPLEQIELLTKPKENIKVIMKDGVIYKNTLPEPK
jgi:imidazolonepropionase-like amidohydrolase